MLYWRLTRLETAMERREPMNLNSQYEFYPPQPDNPTDEERHLLLKYALLQKGWPEDMRPITKRMAPPPPVTGVAEPGSFKGVRVGVLGGGLAGLSAAYELRKMGFDITVFDALTDRVGGRVYTYYPAGDPNIFGEFGPMRIPVAHETVWHYLKLFELPTFPFIQVNPNGFAYFKYTRVRSDASGDNVRKFIYPKYDLRPWERARSWQELLSLGTDGHLLRASQQERLEILEVRERYSRRALEWSNRSNIAMLEAAGLSQAAIDLVPSFVPLLQGNLYSSFIDYIQENYPADLSYLYAVEGGMARLPAAFYQSFREANPYADLPSGAVGRVLYKPGCLVRRMSLGGGSGALQGGAPPGVTVRYEDAGAGGTAEESFDYIVCAIPFSTLRNVELAPMFSNIKMRAIREVNYTPSQKTLLYCSERFWERQGIAGGPSLTDLPVASVWYPPDHARLIRNPADTAGDIARLPAGEPGVIIGAFNFNLDTTRLLNQPDELVLDEIVRELSLIHGLPAEYVRQTVLGWQAVNWNQLPTFRGALSFFTPEQKRLFAWGMAQPEYGGRVFFAGEHISAVHRWMQGALQTGMQAALDLTAAAAKN
jgi:monoamine oxidase